MRNYMSWYCGLSVHKFTVAMWMNRKVIPASHRNKKIGNLQEILYIRLSTVCTQLTHSIFSVFQSVNQWLYTLSTGPTITTNIYKGISS